MSKKLFITGIDSNVNTALISALILKKMKSSGLNCGYFKPFMPATTELCGHLADSDANFVIQFSKIDACPENCSSYWWKENYSPLLKSQYSKKEFSIEKIKYDYSQISKKYNYLLIEGFGNISSPIYINKEEKYFLKDLIWELGLSIILVIDANFDNLGNLNLTNEYALSNGIDIQGIILINYDSSKIEHWINLEQIEILTGLNVIATICQNTNEILLLEGLFKE